MGIEAAAPPAQGATESRPVEHGRQVELDWLRSLVVLGIVPLHVMMTFALTGAVFVHSAVSNPALGAVATFIAAWGIPVIFLMAGAGTKFALEHRSAGAYVGERLLHLGIPLVLIALVFAPLQAYYILLSNPSLLSMSAQLGFVPTLSHPEQLRSFPGFYQIYLTYLVTSVRQLSPLVSNLIFGGLFFVPRLLVVSFLCLPLLVYLSRKGRRWVERVAVVGSNPLVLLLGAGLVPGVLLALLRSGWLERLTAGWPYTDDWSAFMLDLVLFVYGYLIYSSVRLRAAVRELAWYVVGLGAVCTATVVGIMMLVGVPPNDWSPASMGAALAQAFAAWLPALALLGLAMRYLTKPTPALAYLAPAAFPVFVLNTPIQAVSTFYILQLPVYWVVQLVLILVVTLALAFVMYEYVLRRTAVTRFLFGIKVQETSSQPQVPAHERPRDSVPT
jgi:Acyltransferase family